MWAVPIVDHNYSFIHMQGPLENVQKRGNGGRRYYGEENGEEVDEVIKRV